MVKTPDSHKSNDEIDLIELFLKAIVTVQRNLWLIVILFILGASAGFLYSFTTKKQYESKMIISSNILTASYAKVIFDNINAHLTDGDYEILSKDLRISVDEAKQMVNLRIENLTRTEGSELKESERYLITARVFDQKVLPGLQAGIIKYLENNDFVRIRVEQQRSTITQMLAAIEKELADMEKFKDDIYSGKFFNNAKGNVMFDPTTVNTKVLELTQRKIEQQNALELINSVQLIEGFTAFKHHVKPSFSVSLVAGSMLGIFLAGSFIIFKSIRRLLRVAEANAAKNAA